MNFQLLLHLSLLLVQVLGSNIAANEKQQVIRVPITTDLAKKIDNLGLDVWRHGKSDWDVRVNQKSLSELKINGKFEVVVADLNKQIELSKHETRITSNDFFAKYQNYTNTYSWYKNLATNNPELVKYVPSIGKTVEGRDLIAVHITNFANKSTKRVIYLQALMHAREWISGTTVAYLANYFIENGKSDPEIVNYLNQVEIVIVPIVNPDGYHHTHKVDRMWRKNRNKPTNLSVGVDLNRNFPFGWGGYGSNPSPISDSYCGPGPASELETQAVINYTNKLDLIGVIDFHSYGQLVLRPYGNSTQTSPHDALMTLLGDGIRDKIFAVRGTKYVSQRVVDLYEASGIATDHFYGYGDKAISYSIELSPTTRPPGFILPVSEILPVAQEILPSFLYFVDMVIKNPLH